MDRRKFANRFLCLCFFLWGWMGYLGGPLPAHATNAIENIGTGGRSLGMGGVDIGIATDTSAMVSNPGGNMVWHYVPQSIARGKFQKHRRFSQGYQ